MRRSDKPSAISSAARSNQKARSATLATAPAKRKPRNELQERSSAGLAAQAWRRPGQRCRADNRESEHRSGSSRTADSCALQNATEGSDSARDNAPSRLSGRSENGLSGASGA